MLYVYCLSCLPGDGSTATFCHAVLKTHLHYKHGDFRANKCTIYICTQPNVSQMPRTMIFHSRMLSNFGYFTWFKTYEGVNDKVKL